MQVKVQLFALAKERAGCAVIALELPEPATVADVKRALAEAVPALAPLVPNVRIAVNAEYADDGDPIPAGAEVAAIPPVSGGRPEDDDAGPCR